MLSTYPTNHILVNLIAVIISDEEYKLMLLSLYNFLEPPVTSSLLRPNIIFSALCSDSLNLGSSLIWENFLLFSSLSSLCSGFKHSGWDRSYNLLMFCQSFFVTMYGEANNAQPQKLWARHVKGLLETVNKVYLFWSSFLFLNSISWFKWWTSCRVTDREKHNARVFLASNVHLVHCFCLLLLKFRYITPTHHSCCVLMLITESTCRKRKRNIVNTSLQWTTAS